MRDHLETVGIAADDQAAEFCASEPIRTPGSIQPHGYLLVIDPQMRLRQASANATVILGADLPTLIGRSIDAIFGDIQAMTLRALLQMLPHEGAAHVGSLSLAPDRGAAGLFHCVAHALPAGGWMVELELATPGRGDDDLYPILRRFVDAIGRAASVTEMGELAASEVRGLTAFDRVLVYRFDESWSGQVIAEDRNQTLPSYLDLRFPASDIPAQARELYRINRIRLIAQSDYVPVPLVPPDTPLDMSLSMLRSVSPVHLEYMRNMGTGASMSVSLVCEDRLWGLISCHSMRPRVVPFQTRNACELLGQLLSLQLATHERVAATEARASLRQIQSGLLSQVAAAPDIMAGLAARPQALLRLAGADGAALVADGRIRIIGQAPEEAQVAAVVGWLEAAAERELLATDCLSDAMPEAAAFAATASGLLAMSLSQIHPSYALWFRREIIETVHWAGDPRKGLAEAPDGSLRLNPRLSFESWAQTVRGRSVPFSGTEIEVVGELRHALMAIVLRRAEEMAALNRELEQSNRDLEAFSYSVSHDLRAPFRHIVGFAELLRERERAGLSEAGQRYLDKVIAAGTAAGTMVDDLLNFSRLGRGEIALRSVDMDALVAGVVGEAELPGASPVTWRVGRLGEVQGDAALLRIVMQNLIGNAVKYARGQAPAVVEVRRAAGDGETVISVRDNGVGFDMAYVGKLFGVFQRLHRAEEFEGTGIGLANVRRIVERHGGRVWAEGALGQGATFHVALPDPEAA